jgi:hypothetical protein
VRDVKKLEHYDHQEAAHTSGRAVIAAAVSRPMQHISPLNHKKGKSR